MAVAALVASLGDEITDAEEEVFLLFSHDIPSSNLGFIDRKAAMLEIVVGGREFTIHQSPAVLNSSREGGTTGAVLWKITPLFAEWLSSPTNPLFASGILTPSSTVVELGCGIAALNALCLRGAVASYMLTDQPYVARLVAQNLVENTPLSSKTRKPRGGTSKPVQPTTDVRFVPLDWERDDAASLLPRGGVDVVLACDCVYNDALVGPLVDTCADVCRMRQGGEDDGRDGGGEGTVCVVAQQLRHADVLEAWMVAFLESFQAWRVPEEMLPKGLRPGDGFVVHVGVLR